MIRRFLKDRSGATAVEYGLLIGVLSLAIVGGVATATNAVSNLFTGTADYLKNSLD